MWNVYIVIVTALALQVRGRAVLENNGYTDLIVAISPDVPQDNTLIDQIKDQMSDTSRYLFEATRKRAYFEQVKILLPKTWTYPNAVPLDGESFNTAEFRIDLRNSVYGDSPYTVQTTDCGVPGTYTHITPGFIKNSSASAAWGIKGKAIVHEFAKLRWGVYEEHGYTNDDRFPMYYMKPTWTEDGQQGKATPNFCVNAELRGWEQDISTGGSCKYLPSGLPDGNCIFYATQETAATSSYMSLPYLSSNVNFCDSTEELYHDSNLPNKHNLYCGGRSTWEVILESEDFKDNNNPPNNDITDPAPDFIIVGGAASEVDYALVMDISRSMVDFSRFVPMKNAAKRWITYDIEEGTKLVLVFFNQLTQVGFDLTRVDETSRAMMIEAIDKVEADGETCIACGLIDASNKIFNKSTGNVIVLITDGKQNCGTGCPTIAQATDMLVARKTRVITIALGETADPDIEALAERTGGKSYFVDDNSGPGDFNDAFSGSTTYQPGDTLGNTVIVVHQHDYLNVNAGSKSLGTFEVDTTIGRDLTFKLEVTKDKKTAEECSQDMQIALIDPNLARNNLTFRCSKTNFGIYNYVIDEEAVSGRWQYMISNQEALDSLSVKVTSKSKQDNTEPIWSKCWINTGAQGLNSDVSLKLSAMAEVKQGMMPVIGAKVTAYVERPQQSGGNVIPPLELELLDNGAGADAIENDGIYTRYFAQYSGTGRYSVKCQVTGQDDTKVNEGFIQARSRSIPMVNGTRMCCGSTTVF